MDTPDRTADRPPPVPGPIDETAALARVDGDADLLAEIIELFLQDAGLLLDEVRQAVAGGDAAQVMRTAHRLKGSAATLGAVRAADAALALETLGRTGHLAGAPSALVELEETVAEAVRGLRAFRDRSRPAA